MKINIIYIGKSKKSYTLYAQEDFLKKIKKYVCLEFRPVKDDSKLAKAIPKQSYIISLAKEGKKTSSENLAKKIQNLMNHGKSNISFVIGGAHGLNPEFIKKSNEVLSFSDMTFSHELAQIILLEQIYRVFAIINNEPYAKY